MRKDEHLRRVINETNPQPRPVQFEALNALEHAAHKKEKQKYKTQIRNKIRRWMETKWNTRQQGWHESVLDGVGVYCAIVKEETEVRRSQERGGNKKREPATWMISSWMITTFSTTSIQCCPSLCCLTSVVGHGRGSDLVGSVPVPVE